MAYLGNDLQVAYPTYKNIDDISGSFNSSTTSFPLRVNGVAPVPPPLNSQQCLISVGGVVQRPDDSGSEGFRLSGGNIIFASAPTTGADFFGVILAGADYVNVGANFPSGSAAVPSITFDSDLDTGIFNAAANEIGFATGGIQRFHVNSAGQLNNNLGTAAAPSYSFTGDLNTGIYSPGADQVAISTNGTGRLFVNSSGNVGLGVSSPNKPLHIYSGSSDSEIRLQTNSGTEQNAYLTLRNSGGALDLYSVNSDITLNPGNSRAVTVKADGKVGVGTTSPDALLELSLNNTTAPGTGTLPSGIGLSFSSNNGGNAGIWFSGAFGAADQGYCGIAGARDSGFNTSLRFYTNDSTSSYPYTERARIDSSGRLLVGTSSALGNYHQFNALSTASNYLAIVGVHNATNDDVRGIYSYAPNCTTADGFLYLGAVGADVIKFAVRTDGDVQNVNNSYGAYSDVRLKENIVDAASQWDDIKNLQVRKYNFKENTGHATHTQIGLIAQEVELVSPGLVGESQAEPLGDSAETIKTINYSVLYMKAVKALQEAMERIETLEAKVAALETP